MYEDIIENVDWDKDDKLEYFLKGVLEEYDRLSEKLKHIEENLEDIKDMLK